MTNVDELAQQIVALAPAEQEDLLEKVAYLNFQHGLEALAQQYRERLIASGKMDQKADGVLEELERIREEIAAREYQH